MPFRSAILRSAHAATRARMAPLQHCWAGYALDRARNGFYPTFTYRVAFAEELRKAWAEAKARARLDAIPSVEIVLTDDQRAEIDRLEQLADWQPISFSGNERCAAYRLRAACIRNAAARAAAPVEAPQVEKSLASGSRRDRLSLGPKTGPILQSKVHSGLNRRRPNDEARG